MTKPIMKKVNGDGIVINLAVWEGPGQPILCLHGITANCRCWDTLAQAMTSTNHLLAMDLRGRGQSEKPSNGGPELPINMAIHCRQHQIIDLTVTW